MVWCVVNVLLTLMVSERSVVTDMEREATETDGEAQDQKVRDTDGERR